MRGRKPIPTVLKILNGNPGKRPLNQAEPAPAVGIPDCPDHLTDLAKAEWARISKELVALGLLTQLDRSALAAYCQCYARWANAETQIKKTADLGKTKKGAVIQNYWLPIANRALEQMKDYLTEFGLTPVSRSRIKGAEAQGDDAAQKRFFG